MIPAEISKELSKKVGALRFGEPVTHVYNPLEYAWKLHDEYLSKYAETRPRKVLLLGMNPGPWGMAQTGVPFGDVAMVRDWLGIQGEVNQPRTLHPKRPIQGLACPRNEVSGTRLWGWARERYKTPANFFKQFYVHNYCPLCFMESSGRNFTPDKLPVTESAPLYAVCDKALHELILYLQPEYLIGVGAFAEKRLSSAIPAGYTAKLGKILHPSPASPAANRGWAQAAEKQLMAMGVILA